MVYISRDGTVHQEQPWGLEKMLGMVYGFFNMIIAFFQTMVPIDNSDPKSNFRNSGGGRSSGGGGGGGGGGPGYPRPRPPRPGSNIHGLGSTPPGPPPACGSCCGR